MSTYSHETVRPQFRNKAVHVSPVALIQESVNQHLRCTDTHRHKI